MDSMNLYEYVRSNPVMGYDPTGLGGAEDLFDELIGDDIDSRNALINALIDAAYYGDDDVFWFLVEHFNEIMQELIDESQNGLRWPSVSCDMDGLITCLAPVIGREVAVRIIHYFAAPKVLGICAAALIDPEIVSKVALGVICLGYIGWQCYEAWSGGWAAGTCLYNHCSIEWD